METWEETCSLGGLALGGLAFGVAMIRVETEVTWTSLEEPEEDSDSSESSSPAAEGVETFCLPLSSLTGVISSDSSSEDEPSED